MKQFLRPSHLASANHQAIPEIGSSSTHMVFGQNGRPLMGPQMWMSSLVLTIHNFKGSLILTHTHMFGASTLTMLSLSLFLGSGGTAHKGEVMVKFPTGFVVFSLCTIGHSKDQKGRFFEIKYSTLWWTNIAIENGHRNSGFSQLENGGSFHCYVNVHQRVPLITESKFMTLPP